MGKKWKRILRLRRNAKRQVDVAPPALEESAPKVEAVEVAEVEAPKEASREPVKVSAPTTKTAKTKKSTKTSKAPKTTSRRTTKSK